MSACGAVSGSRDSSALDVSKHYDGSDHPFAPCRNVPHAARRGARRGSSDTVHTLGHARRTAHARHRVAMRVARHGHRRERKHNEKENETNRAENGTPGRSSLTRTRGSARAARLSRSRVPHGHRYYRCHYACASSSYIPHAAAARKNYARATKKKSMT